MKESPFFKQSELMIRVIPHVAAEECFALKGGTAINFFFRDLPRLSVDIDLTYVPIENRDISLGNMGEALQRIAVAVRKSMPGIRIQETYAAGSKRVVKLLISDGESQIKVEPNEVIRGTVYPCVESDLVQKAEELFELSTSIVTLSVPDLFGGKLCAAMDRQHPRDLFDVKVLLENEGITEEIRKAFVVYLASHDRPIHEVIDPTRKDVRRLYEDEFRKMTDIPVDYDDLVSAREKAIAGLKKALTLKERLFLVSVKEGSPQWDLLGIKGIDKLPALQWKIINVQKMDPQKQKDYLRKLKEKLEL